MGRLINIHDIDEMSAARNVPDAAVSAKIVSNVRQLHEINDLERCLREILYDPNETPHGPTEIADILTTHVRVNREKRLAGFVLKGRSFQKVTSKDVAHQFAKLRTIPGLGLMVFLAVGNIQDDAQRDFIQAAMDAGCDYLIIDAHDCTRLLIANEKICPQDGTVFDESGSCVEGHFRDKGIPLVMTVQEKRHCTVMNLQDVSHTAAKRYSAVILLDRHYPREVVKDIIKDFTDDLRGSCYYRNEMVKARWRTTTAHVVWLYVAYDPEDIRNANWICRSCWIDENLPSEVRPLPLDGDEAVNDIDIKWNNDYQAHKGFLESHQGTKEQVLQGVAAIREQSTRYAEMAIGWFEEFQAGTISEEDLALKIQSVEEKVTEIYFASGNLPIPPEDCADFDQACQCLFGTIHDLFLYHSKKGLLTWPAESRKLLMQNTIKRYYDNLKKVEFEEKKVH